MKTFVIILFLLFRYGVHCQDEVLKKNFLVVYDKTSNSFRQISLDSNTTFDSNRSITGDHVNKIIIKAGKDFPTLYYISALRSSKLGIHDIRPIQAIEQQKEISNQYIEDFDIDLSQDVYYYAAINLYKHHQNISQELVAADVNSKILSSNFDPMKNTLYFLACVKGIWLKSLDLKTIKQNVPVSLNQCFQRIFIDYEAQELFGISGQKVYSTKLNVNKYDLKTVFKSESKILGLAVGLKHLYYTLEGQNYIYKLERNSSKNAEKFHKFENGNLLALAISEGLEEGATPKTSHAESLNVNIIYLTVSFFISFYILIICI